MNKKCFMDLIFSYTDKIFLNCSHKGIPKTEEPHPQPRNVMICRDNGKPFWVVGGISLFLILTYQLTFQ